MFSTAKNGAGLLVGGHLHRLEQELELEEQGHERFGPLLHGFHLLGEVQLCTSAAARASLPDISRGFFSPF